MRDRLAIRHSSTVKPINAEQALEPMLRKSIAVDMHYGEGPHHKSEGNMHERIETLVESPHPLR